MKDIEQEVKGSLGPIKLHKVDVLTTMAKNDNIEQELSNLRFDMLRAGDDLVTKLGDLENRIIMLERKLRFLVLPEIDDEYIGETD